MLDFFTRLCQGAAEHFSSSARWIAAKRDHSDINGWVDQSADGTWRATGATDNRSRIFTASGSTQDEAFQAWYAQYKGYYGIEGWDADGTPLYRTPDHWEGSEYTPEDVYGDRGGADLRKFWADRARERADWEDSL